jgi:ubiquinone/menaquinone biosynthesis C-methylase UbiE
MLAARLVGPAGEVVGIERDPHSIACARVRAVGAGFRNVSFGQCDVADLPRGAGGARHAADHERLVRVRARRG